MTENVTLISIICFRTYGDCYTVKSFLYINKNAQQGKSGWFVNLSLKIKIRLVKIRNYDINSKMVSG